MNTIVRASGALAGASLLLIVGAWAIPSDHKGPIWWLPYPELWIAIAGAIIFGLTSLVLGLVAESKKRSLPTPRSAPAASTSIRISSPPGHHDHNGLTAILSVRDRSYRVQWPNGVVVGKLIPERSGFNILDESGRHLGWDKTREDGMTRLKLDALKK